MTFVDTLMSFLSSAVAFIGDGITKLLNLLAYPLGWIVALVKGIFYFFFKLVQIVIQILDIFWAFFQLIGALFMGFFRTIKAFLVIDFSQTPLNYPSTTMSGIQVVIERVLQPVGFMTVVPMILLAVVWLLFVIRMFGLLGGGVSTSDD